MDHEEFNFPVFRGMRHQRGYGLGGIFRKMFRYIMPIIKQHGIPILKSVGESTVKGAANFATDTIAGKNIKESANKRLMETFDEFEIIYEKKRIYFNLSWKKLSLLLFKLNFVTKLINVCV